MRKLKNSFIIALLAFCCVGFVGCSTPSVTFNVQYNCFEYKSNDFAGSTLLFHDSQKVTIAGDTGIYTTKAKFLGERSLEIKLLNSSHSTHTLRAKVKGDIVYIYLSGASDYVAAYKKAVV